MRARDCVSVIFQFSNNFKKTRVRSVEEYKYTKINVCKYWKECKKKKTHPHKKVVSGLQRNVHLFLRKATTASVYTTT